MWSLKSGTKELIYKTGIDSDVENKLMVIEEDSGVRKSGKLGVLD